MSRQDVRRENQRAADLHQAREELWTPEAEPPEKSKLWTPATPNPLLSFPHRRWWFKRESNERNWWLHFFGERLVIYRNYWRGQTHMVAVYLTLRWLTINWRPYTRRAKKKNG